MQAPLRHPDKMSGYRGLGRQCAPLECPAVVVGLETATATRAFAEKEGVAAVRDASLRSNSDFAKGIHDLFSGVAEFRHARPFLECSAWVSGEEDPRRKAAPWVR